VTTDSHLLFLNTVLPGAAGKELLRATILLHQFSFLVPNSLLSTQRKEKGKRQRGWSWI